MTAPLPLVPACSTVSPATPRVDPAIRLCLPKSSTLPPYLPAVTISNSEVCSQKVNNICSHVRDYRIAQGGSSHYLGLTSGRNVIALSSYSGTAKGPLRLRFSSLSGMRSPKASIFGRCSPGGVITILPISAASCIWVETVSDLSCDRPRLLRAPIDAMCPDACSHPGTYSEPARKVVHLSQPANSLLLSARNWARSCRGDVVADCGRCAGSSGSLLRSPTRSRSYMSMLTVLGPADAANLDM